MKKISWGRVLALALVLMTVVLARQSVKAACIPAQCTPFDESWTCNPGQHCTAGCCVDDVTPPPPSSPPPSDGGSACTRQVDCGAGECCRGGICRTDCGTPPPPSNSPIGWHDVSSCAVSSGWTCDGDDFNSPVTVQLWNGVAPSFGGTGTYLGSVVANMSRPDVAGLCGGTTMHGFSFTTPDSVKDNTNHSIYAYGVNLGATGSTVLLSGSPKTINCPPACTNTAPNSPTLVLPASEAGLTSTAVTLMWSAPSSWGTNCSGNNNQYQLYLDSCAPAPAPIANPTTLLATVSSATLSRSYTGTRGNTYCWKVRATNGASTTDSAVRRFTIQNNQITGTVYYDPSASCSTANPQNVGGNLVISWGSDSGIFSGGNYTITTSSTGTNNLTLSNIPAGYVCTPSSLGCNNDGCNIQTGVPENASNRNFFLTPARYAWWQVEGGGVYAGSTAAGVNIRSLVPPTKEFITTGSVGEVGLLMRAAGSYDVESAGGSLSSTGWNAVSRYRGRRLDYKYIAGRQGVSSTQATDSAFGAGDALDKPAYVEKDFWYMEPPSGEAVIVNPWNVNAGESYIVIVNGDLRINANMSVANGAFLAIIVSGDITIDPAVTSLQGLYVTDGVFRTLSAAPTTDVQLVTGGSVVAWGGVSLERDLKAANVTMPAEKFVYRPDLIINMPQKMRTYALEWTEVTPGTFGD